VIREVETGIIKPPLPGEANCAESAFCVMHKKKRTSCETELGRVCPYHAAIATAQNSDIIVHNLYSFIFQTKYSDHFGIRPLMIVDEAHDVTSIIRDFTKMKISLKRKISDEEFIGLKTLGDWCDFFSLWKNVSTKRYSSESSRRV
jgi:hypothetical protein